MSVPPMDPATQADTPGAQRGRRPQWPAQRAAVQAIVGATERRIDAERGHVVTPEAVLLPGESRGTGWAETLSEIALRLKIEVEGPADRRQEGVRE